MRAQTFVFALIATVPLLAQPADPRPRITRDGIPAAVIVAGDGESQQFVAGELRHYLHALTFAKIPIVAADRVRPGTPDIVLGGPRTNPLCRKALDAGLVDFTGLTPDGFVIKTIDLAGVLAIVIGGLDAPGNLYGAYDFIESLGVVFQLTGDVIPKPKPDLLMPVLDVRRVPAIHSRSFALMLHFHWYEGLREYHQLFDQMATLKLNAAQFVWGMGSPWLKFSWRGKVAELTNTPEPGYLAWGQTSRSWGNSPHSTTDSRRDVRAGREIFPTDYVGPLEVASVRTTDEAYNTAEDFLHELIRFAHTRHVNPPNHL